MKTLFTRVLSFVTIVSLALSTLTISISAEESTENSEDNLNVGPVITEYETAIPVDANPLDAVSTSIYFTSIGSNDDDKIKLGALLPNKNYTMHIIFKATEQYDIVRDSRLWIPLVAQDATIQADSQEQLGCHLEGKVYNDDGELIDYIINKRATLTNNGKSDMTISYVPNSARLYCYDRVDDTNAPIIFSLSDVDLCSSEFGAPISSRVYMHYDSEANDYIYVFPTDNFAITDDNPCEVQLTIKTAATEKPVWVPAPVCITVIILCIIGIIIVNTLHYWYHHCRSRP